MKEITTIFDYEKLANIDRDAFDCLSEFYIRRGYNMRLRSKIKLTPWALLNGISKKMETGIIIGRGRDKMSIKVIKSGSINKQGRSYWAGFWMPYSD